MFKSKIDPTHRLLPVLSVPRFISAVLMDQDFPPKAIDIETCVEQAI
jgi:hypothetical protein